ncbi:Flagellar FliJ protein [Buchnera aphidicola (Protaphis terricola)]|uniref:flagellar export protein FliJ n=1 Tax=Buchnera aphidicola TaxID=9 RepID=UPI003463FE4F
MKYKKTIFSILENIEIKKIEQEKNNIKNLYIQKKKYIKQLNLLMNFKNEYISKLNLKLKEGIYIDQWKIYNNFIFMLFIAIEESNNMIKKYELVIEKNKSQWLKSQSKLKTWNYFNERNKKLIKKYELLKNQILSDELSQLKLLNKR